MKYSRLLIPALALVVSAGVLSSCQNSEQSPINSSATPSASASTSTSVSTPDNVEVTTSANVMMLSGPTGVGAAYMMDQNESTWNFSVVADNSEVMAALNNGSVDIAATATNVAANLYNKTEGKVTMLAINTEGVLYILEKGDSIQSMSDLSGKTLYAPANIKGGNPEFIFNYLLSENGVEPSELTIEWLTPQEITVKMAESESGIALMPVPAATALLLKDEDVREALDLSAEWDKVSDSPLVMGGLVVRTEFLEENPEVVETFLAEYEQSILYMKDEANLEDAAELVAEHGITASAQIAKRAIPQCNLTFLTGEEMRQATQDYYQVLYQIDSSSIGGAIPYDDFYFIP